MSAKCDKVKIFKRMELLVEKMTLGSIIATLRNEMCYSRKQVCYGLCTTQMLAKIENDEVDTDKLLLDQIIQRLGKSTDNLEIILSDEEYERIAMREELEQAIWKMKKSNVQTYMQKYIKTMPKNNAQTMFIKRTEAYVSFKIEQDFEKAKELLRDAIELTLPGISHKNFKDYLLSKMEMENILALCYLLLKNEDIIQAKLWLEACRTYIGTMISDAVDQTQLNSKVSWLLSMVYIENEDYIHAYDICESAINSLRKYGILHFMLPLLEQIIICCEKFGIDPYKKKWKYYYDMLTLVYQKYGDVYYFHDSIFHNVYRMSFYLAGELIRSERTNRNITQEELIEGVYELPENLSRVEHGKTTPTKKRLEQLMDNLGLERGKYDGTIIVDNFELLEKKKEVDYLIGKGLFEKANECIDSMRKNIDCSKKMNQIALETYDTIIMMKGGSLSEEESYKKFNEILKESYWKYNDNFFRVPFYNEMLSLNMLNILLSRMGREEEGTALLMQIMDVAEASKVDNKYMATILSVIIANINQRIFDKDRCEQGIAYELLCGKGSMLYIHLFLLGKNLDEKNAKREMVRMAFWMSDLFMRSKNNRQIITDYYKETFNESLED